MNQFRVGSVLERSFRIYFKNIVPFLLITALVYVPYAVYLFGVVDVDYLIGESAKTHLLISTVVNIVLPCIATGAIIYGSFMELRGRHAGIGKSLSVGVGRMLPVTGVAVLSILCAIVPFVPSIVMFFVSGGLGLLLGLVGLVFFFVIFIMLYVAVPSAVVERPGLVGALRRSRELTSDRKGAIFGLLFIIGIIQLVFSSVITRVMGGNIEQADLRNMAEFESVLQNSLIAGLITSIVFGALSAVVQSVVYHDLRVEKDGVGVEELAAVFE